MGPGQFALQLGTWIGAPPGGIAGQLALKADVPFSTRVGAAVFGGVQRQVDGTVVARDTVVALSWLPVVKDDLVIRLQPGLSIPTGGIGTGLLFTPLSTSSFDPWASAGITYGSAWLVGLSGVARVPLYRGRDLRRQGPFARVDLRGARRMGAWVPSAGVSLGRQAPSVPDDALNTPDFTDIAAIAGALVNVGERGSVGAQIRAPLWASQGSPKVFAGGASFRWVFGNRIPSGDDDDHH